MRQSGRRAGAFQRRLRAVPLPQRCRLEAPREPSPAISKPQYHSLRLAIIFQSTFDRCQSQVANTPPWPPGPQLLLLPSDVLAASIAALLPPADRCGGGGAGTRSARPPSCFAIPPRALPPPHTAGSA